jgi:hypothetical protein
VLTLALLAAYAITLAFALHLLAAARRREAALRGARPAAAGAHAPQRLRVAARRAAARTLREHPDLGRLAVAVHDTLEAERVAVVISDADEPGTGVVAACFGVTGMLGSRVPVVAEPATGLLSADEVAELGLGDGDPDEEPWAVAQLPIAGADELLGALAVASRRERVFDASDLRLLERLAREGAPRFDRRHKAMIPRAMA